MGRVAGHRGRHGELTVRVGAGDAESWTGAPRFLIANSPAGPVREFEVEASRAYKDRLVLKLRGIDDANAAEGLRGADVSVRREDAATLAAGEHYRAALVGMTVIEDGSGREVGVVQDVVPTGGADLLQLESTNGDVIEEVLIPFVREIVTAVDEDNGTIRVRMPEGLEDLNRSAG